MPTLTVTSGFTSELTKKITKTREARNGEGIYKRRNRRTYRVIMQLITYQKLHKQNPQKLEEYKDGFAVRVKPEEYFQENGEIQSSFPKSLTLGKNAFIYFKLISSWNKFSKFCKNFREVVELTTTPNQEDIYASWIGEYCLYIKNANPQKVSLICTTSHTGKENKVKELTNKLIAEGFILPEKDIDNLPKLPAQAGLGNWDYDYASEDEMEKICYQMAFLIYKTPGMKKELSERKNETIEKIDEYEKHVISYCKSHNLLDFNKLSQINAYSLTRNVPICPLCKKELNAVEFFTSIEQDEGREEEDNTQSSIELMHVEPLKSGELNHRTYNLGWGHKHCNIIQGPLSISETLEKLKSILQSNEM